MKKWFSLALEAWLGFCKNIPKLRESINEKYNRFFFTKEICVFTTGFVEFFEMDFT
jgi:hypothetical protein